MASRYAYLRVGGSLASLRRFGDDLEACIAIVTSLRQFGDEQGNLRRVAMNSDRFVMSTGSFEAFTAIERRFELIESRNSGIQDQCGSIALIGVDSDE